MESKPCRDCGVTKPLSDFYKHKMMKDGYLNSCKECRKTAVKKNYAEKIDEKHAYEAKRNATPDRKKALSDATRRHRQRNPLKYKARMAVNNAIRDGRLARGPCETCGTTENLHAHHDDYSKPLAVRWLCFTCHRGDEHEHLLSSRTETAVVQ